MGDEDVYDADNTGVQGNPAWQQFYSVIPTELHEKVTPLLNDWDQGVQKRFTQVQSEYAPYKEFKEAKIDPEDMRFALQLMNTLSEDPEQVYKAIKEHYKFGDTQGAGTGQGHAESSTEQEQPQYATASELADIRRQNEIMAQILIRNKEAEREKQNDALVEAEFTAAKKKYGEFDERYVAGLMIADPNLTTDAAVAQFKNFVTNEAAKYRPKPLFMGAGGGVPGQQTDVSKLDDKSRKMLAVNFLKAANAERSQ